MSERYSQPNYCAVVRGQCPHRVELLDRGLALAYPFQEWAMGWAEGFAATARSSDVPLIPPHERFASTYVICNVCTELRARPTHLAEVTEPNWNVFYESGFAFGSDKIVILAEDANADTARSDAVFPEYLRARYHTSVDLLKKTFAAATAPTLRISQVVATEDPRRLYFIDPGIESEQTHHLRKTLRRIGGYSYSAPEGGIIRTPTMRSELTELRGAALVVGLLVPRNYKDADVINARTCFLAGVAVALEKPVLLLLQEPEPAGPADLLLLTERFAKVSSIKPILDAWLLSVRESRTQAPAARPDVRKFDLGNAAAERDPSLEKYFLETAHSLRARDGSVTVFLGRRGAGKSAIAMMLADEYERDRSVAFRAIRPEAFEMEELQEAYDGALSEVGRSWRLVLGSAWRYLLLAQIARAYIERYKDRAVQPEEVQQLHAFLSIVPHDDDFVDAVIAVTGFVKTATTEELKAFRAATARGTTLIPFRALSRDRPARLILDNLDAAWDLEHERSRFVLASLVREAETINRQLNGRVAILLFLRTEIYNVIRLVDPDVDKQTHDALTWDVESLENVVGLRLAYLLDMEAKRPSQAWGAVFPRVVHGQNAADYLVAHTLRRPRELIKLCMLAIAAAQRRDSHTVSEADVLTAVQEFSDVFLAELHGEYLLELPDLYYFVSDLAGETWPKSIDEMRGLIRLAATREQQAGRGHSWMQDGVGEPDAVLMRLFDVGVIGLAAWERRTSGRELKATFKVDSGWTPAYAKARTRISQRYGKRGSRLEWQEPLVVLHPALHSVLGIAAAIPHDPYTHVGPVTPPPSAGG